jgi:hypothetical protein
MLMPPIKTPTTTIPDTQKFDGTRFINAPGWAWLMRPEGLRLGRRFGEAHENVILSGYSVVDAEGGALRVFVVQAGPGVLDPNEYRLVVFDAAGKRYLPKATEASALGSTTTKVRNALFTLDPKTLAPGKAEQIGFECIVAKAP